MKSALIFVSAQARSEGGSEGKKKLIARAGIVIDEAQELIAVDPQELTELNRCNGGRGGARIEKIHFADGRAFRKCGDDLIVANHLDGPTDHQIEVVLGLALNDERDFRVSGDEFSVRAQHIAIVRFQIGNPAYSGEFRHGIRHTAIL